MPQRPVYPWDALRTEYTQGWTDDQGAVTWPRLEDVAAKYQVRADHVRRRAAREHWVDKRALHQAELERARREARSAEYLAMAERIDGNAITVAERGLQLVHARIQELMAVQGQRLQQLQGGQVPGASGAVDAMELTRLSLAGIRWHQLAMRAVGQEDARGGLGAGTGDATDLAAMVVTERERNLAATIGARVREAIDVASQQVDVPEASVTPSSGPTHVLADLLLPTNGAAH